jgi:short subunit dehydrogenase-like uncharacterized protein
MSRWVLYGATGYTGTLLSEEAARRGLRPILAGRNPEKLRALGERLGMEWKAVSLEDSAGLRALLDGAGAVLHAAGPFLQTSQPMADACLDVGCSYLDITGELQVFEALFARDADAKAKQVALIPGVGFDVVPTDCLAAWVASRLPGAQSLEIAIAILGQPSAGTVKSLLGLLPIGGKVRRDGALVSFPIGKGVHRVRFSSRESWAVPVPIADLITAWHSTKIPNVTVSTAVPSALVGWVKVGWPLGVVGLPVLSGLLRSSWVRARIDAAVERRNVGPDAVARARNTMYVYAKAATTDGRSAEGWMETVDGYEFTKHSAISAVEQVLAKKPIGALSPSQAFGADFALGIPGTRRLERLLQSQP